MCSLLTAEVTAMPNAVLESLRAQRAEQIATMDSILGQVEGRDLVDAERGLLDAARDRIRKLDDQITPLEQFEALRGTHSDVLAGVAGRPTAPSAPMIITGGDRAPVYRTAGEFVVDLIRARGIHDRGVVDAQAAARIAQTRVVADQKTSDTPGVLPTPIVGQVVNMIDANRPLISSLGGAKALGGIPGATFTRPKITQHTLVGVQAGEKTQLPSQKMTITGVPFTKATYGGTVDISRQDIDWTSPSAWDILIKDLANVYAIQTETAVATAFKTAATHAPVVVATNTLADWTKALYLAAADSYVNALMMPDRIWCSLDVWAALGALVDVARVVFAPDPATGDLEIGGSSLADFRGDILGLPRIVVPTFPAGTCIVGPSALYEAYEEVIGLLSVVEPSILGVQVAYGGYVAFGSLAGAAFVPLTPPAGLTVPSIVDTDGDDDDDTAKSKRSSK
jgi:HK97 family phage major capsid protein